MDQVNQYSNFTNYNRYPNHFYELTQICINPDEILSFGCSTGEEVYTLKQLYYPNSNITGYDISSDIINNLITTNTANNVHFINHISNTTKYDLILCMSVFCRWPEELHINNPYTFELFNKSINDIDKLIKLGGYIVIYNSKYLFTDTEISKKYSVVDTINTDTGFVTKYSNNIIVTTYPYYLFKKINI